MNPDIASLEAILREQPSDWSRWLVYADVLQEQGDVRGNLIIIEHQISQFDGSTATLPPDSLYERREALIQAHQDEWFGPHIFQTEGICCFPHRISLDGVGAAEKLSSLLERPYARFLTEIVLRGPPDTPLSLATFQRLTIENKNTLGDPVPIDLDSLERLAGEGGLSELREIVIEGQEIGWTGLGILLHKGNPRALRTLRLAGAGVGNEGCALIAAMTRSLVTLDLSDNGVDGDGVTALAGGVLAQLSKLQLNSNSLGRQGISRLAAGASRRLTALGLADNDIDIDAVLGIVDAENLASLVSLDLSSNLIGDSGAAALASSRCLSELSKLDLRGNEIGDEGAEAIARAGGLGALTEINLGYNHIGAQGASALVCAAPLERLKVLGLVHNRIDDAIERAITGPHCLPSLTAIDLTSNALHMDTVRTLSCLAKQRGIEILPRIYEG